MAKTKKSKTLGKRIDVRSKQDIPAFESLLSTGPMTIVLVHADWCGHCQTFKENVWNKVPNSPTNKINTASVHHDMLENTSLAGSKLEGYPSLLLVGKDKKPAVYKNNEGETTNAMPQPKTADELNQMVNTPVNENIGNANSINVNSVNTNNTASSVSTASNILSMNNSNSNNNSVRSYKPANMADPPNAADDLVNSQQVKKQMGGGLYQSLLKIMAQMKTRRSKHKSSKKRGNKQTRRH